MGNAIQEMVKDGEKRGEKRGVDMLIKLLKLLEPGSPEYEKALNATPKVRQKMYEKYNITE